MIACEPCGMPLSVEGVETHSVEWWQLHKARHVGAFPALDVRSIRALDDCISHAEETAFKRLTLIGNAHKVSPMTTTEIQTFEKMTVGLVDEIVPVAGRVANGGVTITDRAENLQPLVDDGTHRVLRRWLVTWNPALLGRAGYSSTELPVEVAQ